jgi:hypothetical protein
VGQVDATAFGEATRAQPDARGGDVVVDHVHLLLACGDGLQTCENSCGNAITVLGGSAAPIEVVFARRPGFAFRVVRPVLGPGAVDQHDCAGVIEDDRSGGYGIKHRLGEFVRPFGDGGVRGGRVGR